VWPRFYSTYNGWRNKEKGKFVESDTGDIRKYDFLSEQKVNFVICKISTVPVDTHENLRPGFTWDSTGIWVVLGFFTQPICVLE
jgi:intracellular sulfur oxidation DsrE/DsrF family protein